MAHSYRTLQQWNHWLHRPHLGAALLKAEASVLERALAKHYGKHAVLIGVPNQADLFHATTQSLHTIVGPMVSHTAFASSVESHLHELPFLSGSIDLVLLPHTLEHVENPRQLLAEACRIIKPEGLIVVTAFNPYSLWGVAKKMAKEQTAPWCGHFIPAHKIENWLRLADFEIEQRQGYFYRPPLTEKRWFDRLQWLEKIHYLFPSLGGVNTIVARAKVTPLTPIRMKWKQQLSGIRLPASISSPIARQNETYE